MDFTQWQVFFVYVFDRLILLDIFNGLKSIQYHIIDQ